MLGSSCRVNPAAMIPEQADRVACVNLQPTPIDELCGEGDASLRIHGTCDEVMRLVLKELGVKLPAAIPAGRWAARFEAQLGAGGAPLDSIRV